jgi:hypothetical protein
MKENTYRLGEYKIIESNTGQLLWEAHFGFGEIQKGPCFGKESILFIGPAESYQNGFLKGEYLDDLKKYPKWAKTKFYCIGVGVRHCNNGNRVTQEEMMLWMLSRSRGKGIEAYRSAAESFSNGSSVGKGAKNEVYRLQRYEITVGADGHVISRTYSGSNTVTCGNCYILENILFIGPQESKPSSFDKRQFLASLRQRPIWDQTAYFSKRFSLHECKPGNEVKEERKNWSHKINLTKKEGAEENDKNKSIAKSAKDTSQASFTARSLAVLGLVVGFMKSWDENDRLSSIRFIKSYFSKGITFISKSSRWILKKIFHTVALTFYMATSLIASIFGYLKKCRKKMH